MIKENVLTLLLPVIKPTNVTRMGKKYLWTVVVALAANTITLAYGHLLTFERFAASALIIVGAVGVIFGIILLLRKAKLSKGKR